MSAIRSLLAATDFSDDATLALQRAARLARQLDAKLEVIHVTDAAQGSDAHVRLDEAVAALGVSATPRLETGPVNDALLEAAGAHDLLVLGARGASRVREVLLGSTAERLLVRSTRPILVVRRAADAPYRRVVVPCEFAPPAKRALLLACEVAPEAALTLLHCLDAPGEEARVHEWLRRLGTENAPGRKIETRVEHGSAAGAVLAAAEDTGADLVVAGKQGRSRAGDLFLGSVTRRILNGAPCDVLVAPLSSAD